MASLYEISNRITDIFNTIESQDGEVTDEQYEALAIGQEELNDKLDAYVKAIKEFQKDADFCKAEKKSIGDRQNVYKNRIERLKKAVLDAVLAFGNEGRTNRYVELPDCRVFSKTSQSVELDSDRIGVLMTEFARYTRELVSQDVLYTGKDVDMQGILDCINANIRAEQGDSFQPYTLADLAGLKVTVSQTATICDMFKSGYALTLYGAEPAYTVMEPFLDKEAWKSTIKDAKAANMDAPTIAKLTTNQTLQIK